MYEPSHTDILRAVFGFHNLSLILGVRHFYLELCMNRAAFVCMKIFCHVTFV